MEFFVSSVNQETQFPREKRRASGSSSLRVLDQPHYCRNLSPPLLLFCGEVLQAAVCGKFEFQRRKRRGEEPRQYTSYLESSLV